MTLEVKIGTVGESVDVQFAHLDANARGAQYVTVQKHGVAIVEADQSPGVSACAGPHGLALATQQGRAVVAQAGVAFSRGNSEASDSGIAFCHGGGRAKVGAGGIAWVRVPYRGRPDPVYVCGGRHSILVLVYVDIATGLVEQVVKRVGVDNYHQTSVVEENRWYRVDGERVWTPQDPPALA